MSWEVVDKIRRITNEDVLKELSEILTLGFLEHDAAYIYIVEDDNGNQRKVIAADNYDLGDKIDEGDFEEVE